MTHDRSPRPLDASGIFMIVAGSVGLCVITAYTALAITVPPATPCSTDADCAAWEARTGVPEALRCDGAPCPPLVTNLPVIMPDGTVGYVCATQLRGYGDFLHPEVDHYIQGSPCPATPIK